MRKAIVVILFIALVSGGFLTHFLIQKNANNELEKTEEPIITEETTIGEEEEEYETTEDNIPTAEPTVENQLKCTSVEGQTYYTDSEVEFTISDTVKAYTKNNKFLIDVQDYNQYEYGEEIRWTFDIHSNKEIVNVKYSAYDGKVSYNKETKGNNVTISQEFSGPHWDTVEISLNVDGEIYTAVFYI